MKANGASSGFGDEWLRFAGVKLAMDGGHDAAHRAYAQRLPGRSEVFRHGLPQPRAIRAAVEIADRYGWRVGVHVVGDKATDVALDAYEALDKKSPIAGKRFILIHASLIQRDQMERAKKLGVRTDVQNIFMWDKAATVERFLGRETADRRCRRAPDRRPRHRERRRGDGFPGEHGQSVPQHVRHGDAQGPERDRIRRKGSDQPRGGAAPLHDFARALHVRGGIKGSIEPGKLADLVVLSADPADRSSGVDQGRHALTTIVGGKVVFQR
jgi:predicted amidohydrolase YtcJ